MVNNIDTSEDSSLDNRIREILKDYQGMDFCQDPACTSWQACLKATEALKAAFAEAGWHTEASIELAGDDYIPVVSKYGQSNIKLTMVRGAGETEIALDSEADYLEDLKSEEPDNEWPSQEDTDA